MRAVTSAVVWAMTGVAALAQEAIDTPSGPAVIRQDGTGHVLLIAGMGFPIKGMMYVDFAARVGDLVLVAQYSGGTLCPARFAWLDTSPGRVRMTESFGTCSDSYEIAAEDGTVRVTMPDLTGDGRRVFVWDGMGRVVEQPEGVAAVAPGPGRDVAGWVGMAPLDLLGSPDWEGTFTALMGAEALARVREGIVVGSGLEMQGDWVAGRGCQPQMCDEVAAAVAIHLKDGRALVAYWRKGERAEVWGDASAGFPPAVAEVMALR